MSKGGRRVHEFLDKLSATSGVTKSQLRLELARTINRKEKLVKKRRQERKHIRTLTRNLKATEAQIDVQNNAIKELKSALKESGSDEEDSDDERNG